MSLRELVYATCPRCAAGQYFRRELVGTAVYCQTCGASGFRFVLPPGPPLGRRQWETSTNPNFLVACVAAGHPHPSARKRRLVAVAACRAAFDWCKNHWFRAALDAAERVPDGMSARDREEIIQQLNTWAPARQNPRGWIPIQEDWAVAALWCLHPDPVLAFPTLATRHPGQWLAAVREVIPNPFHPPAVPDAWRTTTALGLARGIDAERAFDRLPILADALEDAGCTEHALLAHLRGGGGPHARGCWALDAVLGRS